MAIATYVKHWSDAIILVCIMHGQYILESGIVNWSAKEWIQRWRLGPIRPSHSSSYAKPIYRCGIAAHDPQRLQERELSSLAKMLIWKEETFLLINREICMGEVASQRLLSRGWFPSLKKMKSQYKEDP